MTADAPDREIAYVFVVAMEDTDPALSAVPPALAGPFPTRDAAVEWAERLALANPATAPESWRVWPVFDAGWLADLSRRIGAEGVKN